MRMEFHALGLKAESRGDGGFHRVLVVLGSSIHHSSALVIAGASAAPQIRLTTEANVTQNYFYV